MENEKSVVMAKVDEINEKMDKISKMFEDVLKSAENFKDDVPLKQTGIKRTRF